MDFLRRLGQGIRLYAVLLGTAMLIAVVWWANGAFLGNTTAETGWPVIVGVVAVPVVAVLVVKLLYAGSGDEPYDTNDEPYDWQS